MNGLTPKQKKVMDELFEGKSEEIALADNNVSQRQFNNWVNQDNWCMEYEARIQACQRQAQTIIAVYSPVAAAKLVQLTECKKEATARQACLDIMQMDRIVAEFALDDTSKNSLQALSQETITEMVKVLARDAQRKRENKSKKDSGNAENQTTGE